MNVDGFVSSLLLVLTLCYSHQTAMTQAEALARAEEVPVLCVSNICRLMPFTSWVVP